MTKYLILAAENYIVFIDNENDIDWQTSDSYDKIVLNEEDKKVFNSIMNEAAQIESFIIQGLDLKEILNFKRQIGEALVRNFEHDFESAKQMLKFAKEYIINRNIDKSRFLYLKASGILTLTVLIIGIFAWLFRFQVINYIGITAFFLLLASINGSLGSFLSIILRMGNTNLDFNANNELHYMEAASKIIAGMISGFLIGLSIKSGILLPIFNNINSTHLAMILGGLIAGLSERLVPSIIQKIDGSKK